MPIPSKLQICSVILKLNQWGIFTSGYYTNGTYNGNTYSNYTKSHHEKTTKTIKLGHQDTSFGVRLTLTQPSNLNDGDKTVFKVRWTVPQFSNKVLMPQPQEFIELRYFYL